MLEKILGFSLAQRFLVILAALALIGFGVASWRQLTLDAVPDITTNQVQINTRTGGMAPPEIEKLVTSPIETVLGGLPGVEGVRSLSQFGLSQVTVTFTDRTDTYFARQLVTERLNSVREQLPAGVAAPELAPVSTGLGEVFVFSVDSTSLSPMELRTLFDWQIRPQLRTVAGVAEVNATGGYEKQYEVQPDPQRLRARGISLDALLDALRRNNANVGGGFIERQGEQLLVRSVGAVTGIADIERIVVRAEGGTPIFVHDVATVGLGTPVRTGLATRDGKETVLGIVMMLKGANGRTVASAARERLAVVQKQVPTGVTLTPVYDRSHLVNQAVGTVQKSLVEGGIFVLAVLLLLLGNVRGALIVALAIPLSMLFAFINMSRFGISGNLMSLGAIDFGLIVDGAVVMVEHAVAELAHARETLGRTLSREEVRAEVGKACRDVARPVAFAVTIITVVYLPILALEGIEGKMFHPMAYTVVFALIGALILTLTLVPALCSLLLSGDTREGNNPVMGFFARIYRPALDGALRRRWLVVCLAGGFVGFSSLFVFRLGSEFVPQLDEGDVVVQPVRLRTVGEKETLRLVTAMERRLQEFPEVVTVFSRSGTPEVATDPMPMSLTDSTIALRPRNEWRRGLTKERLIAEMEEALKDVPGQGYSFTQPIQMRFSELVAGVKADVGIKVFGEDLDTLKRNADAIAAVLGTVPGAADVSVEQVDDVPVLQLTVDREAAARVGVSASEVQEWIGSAFTGEPLGQVIEGDKRFDLVVRLSASIREDMEAVKDLPIATPSGGTVTLGSLARFETVGQPAQISRESGRRRVVVQCNVRGADLGSFVAAAQQAIEREITLPSGHSLEWGGQFENLQRARARLTIVVPLALALIFLLLFLSFGSLKQAALIFTGVPLAVTGGVLGLVVRGMPFSISAGIGFIALSGVAVLNGVVLVSAINRLRREGMRVPDALREGARSRLRPVLMTALVASLGFVPMALNTGIGAEVQRPLATVVIGGIVSSTLLTLLVLPVLYGLFERQPDVAADISPEAGEGGTVVPGARRP
jgi:cobalt-zinc-cadmium resistance protein CzcA